MRRNLGVDYAPLCEQPAVSAGVSEERCYVASALMPVLFFLPVFLAIGYLIANQKRGPQPALTGSERRTKTFQVSIAAAVAVAIAVSAMLIIRHV